MSYQPWMNRVVKGSVLQFGKSFRIVRRATRYKHGKNAGRLRSVTLSIKRCSWTTRCYTIMTYNDLYYRKAKFTGTLVKLNSQIDKKIEKEIISNSRPKLTCCDVDGVS